MTLAWATDLHLDVVEPRDVERFCNDLLEANVSGILLGGDISEAQHVVRWLEFLDSRLQTPIFYVLGNHDYYGSDIATTRASVRALNNDRLHYLPQVGRVQLAPGVALIGHDGWGDCRIGAVDDFQILTDYVAIADLGEMIDREALLGGRIERDRLRQKLRSLGDDAGEALRPHLLDAAATGDSVLVLTHVPPFRESCWHRGVISEETWLPGFTCKAVGDLLDSVAEGSADTRFTVLCGHTHCAGHARMRPNLEVHTGFGDYGTLRFGTIRIEKGRIEVTPPVA